LNPQVDAIVLLACDQPFVNKSIIRSLNLQRTNSGKSIVASCYADTLGVPVLFDRIWFDSLLSLPDQSGAKALINAISAEVAQIEFPQGIIDIDSPDDFERLTRAR
jgi:molybdenum cofactor cytidylyltransferase